MAKVIKVSAGEVTIAQNNGELITVPDHAIDFVPKVNDLVEFIKQMILILLIRRLQRIM